jgi:hypothetical protein
VAKVIEVEENTRAVEDARFNARDLPEGRVEFHEGKVEEVLEEIDQPFTLAVVDPPRAGMEREALEAIVEGRPRVIAYVVAIVVIAFIFDFSNGFHDSANSIATIVGTRVLSPLAAVLWAAVFNFAAAFTGSLAVAKAIGGGMIEQSIVNPNVILGGLLGAIIWNIITWYFGIPSSSSHALIGGYAGAAVAKAGRTMPQKSTYFFPKLTSGLFFMPLE